MRITFFFFGAPARFRPLEGLSNRLKHGKHDANRFFLLSFFPLIKPLDYIHKGSPQVLFLHLTTGSFLRHKGLTINILLKVFDFSLNPLCPSSCDVTQPLEVQGTPSSFAPATSSKENLPPPPQIKSPIQPNVTGASQY